MRYVVFALVVAVGCGSESPQPAGVAATGSLEQVVRQPLEEDAVLAAAAVIADLPEAVRPRFEPAIQVIPTEGRRGRDLADAYRRQFREALDIVEQTERWGDDKALLRACEVRGISVEDFALTLMRVGCAHHAAEVGSRVDLGEFRARTKTEIASLCDRIDGAPDALTRRTLCGSLSSAVALDTYLTLLDGVPSASEALVTRRRAELTGILPQQAAMDIRPAR